MVALRVVVPLGLLLGTVGGCAGGRDGDAGGNPGSACEPLGGGPVADTAVIGDLAYRVTGGFSGDGDGTSLQIKPDGTLTRTTAQRGTEQGQLDQATLDGLAGTARAAQFPTLCAIYPCSDCGDEYTHDVSVQIDGTTYRVQASVLAPPLPDRLQALIEALQVIVARPLP